MIIRDCYLEIVQRILQASHNHLIHTAASTSDYPGNVIYAGRSISIAENLHRLHKHGYRPVPRDAPWNH